ncbi:MAG: TfoX/Sxy family protein [Oscillospiraceae bacterium]|nr:TfoX/Sxy family protein [Oscillospiraceae bacterium]
MASSKSCLDFVLEQFSEAEGVSARAMMGEYILYVRGKVFGGVYDDRLPVKGLPAAAALLPDAPRELPYPGGREMLLVEDLEDRKLLRALAEALDEALPAGRRP